MAIFAGKEWNDNVFMKYYETIPKIKQNAFLKAGIFRTREDIKAAFSDQVGGNYVTVPMTGKWPQTVYLKAILMKSLKH